MSVLAVGVSHRSAPVPLLERVAIRPDELAKVLVELRAGRHIDEAMVLSTCNRTEVYADVDKFHGGLGSISELLSRVSGVDMEELTAHLYVHYEDRAVAHLFTVACGLDSMVVGEGQILGQLRAAHASARAEHALGRVLHPLVQQALRVGKRVHTETGLDRAGQSLVSVGLELAAERIGGLAGRPGLVVGAGSMAALAATTLARAGVTDLAIANRTPAHAAALARRLGARDCGLDGLGAALTEADVVVCSTGATGIVLDMDTVAAAVAARGGRPVFLLDLALPRDVDPAVRELDGVTLVDLDGLRQVLDGSAVSADVEAARRIVTEEVGRYLTEQRSARVAPTVIALRTKAAKVVDAELVRLNQRVQLDDPARREVADTVRRVVDKLLHTPTVRVKELAGEAAGDAYAQALRELFELDPAAPAAVTSPAPLPAEEATR